MAVALKDIVVAARTQKQFQEFKIDRASGAGFRMVFPILQSASS